MASEAKNSNKVEIFSYIARDKKSSVVKGEIKAVQERMVVDQLKKMGLDPISITVKKVSVFEKLDINVFDSVPPDAIYNFSRQLSVMLKAGVPLIDALESMLSKTINPLLNKTVEKIIENLTEENSDLSKKILSIIEQKSPTSLKVALKSLRLGKNISFEECMQMEFRMVNKVMNDHDFYEGVRALIIDKDNNPSWKPGNISEVEENFVDKFFSSLDDDLKFN